MNPEGSPDNRIAPPPPAAPPPADVPGAPVGFQARKSRLLVELLVLAGVAVGLSLALYALAGRLAAWALPLVPWEVDQKIGQASEAQLQLQQERCPDAAQRYVQELGERLLGAAGRVPVAFHFRAVRDSEVNAFALPGGYVTINSGLLDTAENGEEIAAVLAHEIQHALRRHGTQRVLRGMGGQLALGLLFGGTDLDGVSGLTGQLSSLAYGREEEAEADRLGTELLVRAGIRADGLGSFFARLQKEDGMKLPEFLSTHPDPGVRVQRAKAQGGAEPGPVRSLPPVPRHLCGGEQSR